MFQFPANPLVGDLFTPVTGVTYRWNGTAWYLIAGPGAFISQSEADERYVQIEEARNITNRIINGKFAIDQRNAGAAVSVASAPVYSVDRWVGNATAAAGAFSMQREADALYPGEFRLKLTVTGIDGTIGAAEIYNVIQRIEGTTLADISSGSANAQQMTLAFEVESTVTGTFPIAFTNSAFNRSYVTSFAVNAANTRETKTITLTADTAGTWLTDTGIGLQLFIGLGNGSDYNAASANVWSAGGFITLAGMTNFMSAANTMRLKNVRLYKGAVDFGPDRRLYAEELALCQRYYQKSYSADVVPGTVVSVGCIAVFTVSASAAFTRQMIHFPTTMRTTPTVTLYATATGTAGSFTRSASGTDAAMTVFVTVGESSCRVYNTNAVSLNEDLSGHYAASAEL